MPETSSPGSPQTAPERRSRATRKPMRSLGYVVVPGNRKELECIIVDMSASGAKLKLIGAMNKPFAPQAALPRQFKLIIRNDKIEVDCNVAWANANTFGVSFASPFRPSK
jgi:hypothetical protein